MIRKPRVVVRQEVHWVPPERALALPQKPFRVWTLYEGIGKPDEKPALPFTPQHHVNAFLEDYVHDWNWAGGRFRYYSRAADHSVWVLVEYDQDETPKRSNP